ncbi:Clavaminate synthase-like protein [Neolentinus lepideus HHB14362 ss-1]|uniref:Clavaminate synthase-like protein n=1 Tax=Neolentinus lepideus HHB14362 ss-1 TaxID=1314782 RepID=A0A165Q5C8_9AGAM|nr:Clavaminate synthase-like protein [Neolentinus lepideus HHB14362 ss-1]
MTIELLPLPLPPSADPAGFVDFGKEVRGVDIGNLSDEDFENIHSLLYKHSLLLFRSCDLTPEQQYALTKRFDPTSESFGHGNNKIDQNKKSILHPDLKTIARVPQVQLIGNGVVHDHEEIPEAKLKHPSHVVCHKEILSDEDTARGYTRFYRWHIDAALYNLRPSKVTTLYAIKVPKAPKQIVRYDDGTGDELEVSLGCTAFTSTRNMFNILPPELKSVAVRTRVKYAPHPYVWMAASKLYSNGIGIIPEGKELSYDELPPWDESKVKVYPMLWKNPVTGELHFQVHPGCVAELYIDSVPEGISKEGKLYPDGAHLTNLKQVRELLYTMQRPAIAPKFVYPHDWSEKDLVLFHNRGMLHCIVGTFKPDQIRVLHQCNLAASDDPTGPNAEDVKRWA